MFEILVKNPNCSTLISVGLPEDGGTNTEKCGRPFVINICI
jgi:hypothetical protein